jgi:ketosteroid isomerase-like protein
MTHPNDDLLRRGYAAYSSGDMDTVQALMGRPGDTATRRC